MKKELLVIITWMSAAGFSLSANYAPHKQLVYSYEIAGIVTGSFLFIAGAWLAHKQLPRMAGQHIEYNAPLFTKVFASLLFTIGSVGGTVGAYGLCNMICDVLNRACLAGKDRNNLCTY